jgi:hypothetical protein
LVDWWIVVRWHVLRGGGFVLCQGRERKEGEED